MDIKPPKKQRPYAPISGSAEPYPTDTVSSTSTEPAFQPPETVAANDEPIELPTSADYHIEPQKPKRRITKKHIAIVLIAVASIGLFAAGWYFFVRDDDQQTATDQPAATKKAEPKKFYSPLTGREVKDDAATAKQVTGVMIENSPEARPQSGLVEAGAVVEAIAEGGITRFVVFYQDSDAASIGPVRSARPYYIDYALGFDSSYGHVGGSPQALADIKALGVKDMDQFFNASAYQRISGRYAPHNVYTSTDKLRTLEQAKGYTKSSFKALVHKRDVPQTPKAAVIDFSISGPLYSPRFVYDKTTNSYLRQQAGAAHVDDKGKQINPKVVIALVTSKSLDSDGSHSVYKTTGTGKAYVFQDGVVSEATWTKPERKSSLQLTDRNGLPLKINRGQLWIALVGQPADVQYKL